MSNVVGPPSGNLQELLEMATPIYSFTSSGQVESRCRVFADGTTVIGISMLVGAVLRRAQTRHKLGAGRDALSECADATVPRVSVPQLWSNVSRSQIVFEVKPWEAETDLKALFGKITAEKMEGLAWGEAYKLAPVAFGVKKLILSCVVEDDKVRQTDGHLPLFSSLLFSLQRGGTAALWTSHVDGFHLHVGSRRYVVEWCPHHCIRL